MDWVKIDYQVLLADHNSGMSLGAIARKYGASRPTVKKKLIKCGVQTFNYIANHKDKFKQISHPKHVRQLYNNTFQYTRDEQVLRDRFIEKARKVHGDKYNYSKVEYAGPDKRVKIICKVHAAFWQTQSSHLKGHGCPKCGLASSSQR